MPLHGNVTDPHANAAVLAYFERALADALKAHHAAHGAPRRYYRRDVLRYVRFVRRHREAAR